MPPLASERRHGAPGSSRPGLGAQRVLTMGGLIEGKDGCVSVCLTGSAEEPSPNALPFHLVKWIEIMQA